MEKEINEYFEKLVSEGVFPGACYAFFKRGKIIMGSVGKRSLEPKLEENSIDTIYDLASLTKLIVTNTLIEQLLYESKISLSDPVQKYFNIFPYDNVTILHLLTHTSGIYALYDKNNIKDKNEFFTNIKLDKEPGTDIDYRDINYILLGFLIERVYNDTLDNLSQKYIFKPLSMNQTTYLPKYSDLIAPTEYDLNGNMIRGTVHDEKARVLNGIAGHAGIFGTINDVVRFVECILNNGEVSGKQVIRESVIENWFTPRVTGTNTNKRSFGWLIGNTAGDTKEVASKKSIYHTGFTGNIMFIDKQQDYAFILLSNRVHPTRDNKKLVERRKEIIKDTYKIIMRGE